MKSSLNKTAHHFSGMDRTTRLVFILFLLLCISTCLAAGSLALRFIKDNLPVFDFASMPLLGGKSQDDALDSLVEPWDGSQRVNILVMGLDNSQQRYDVVPHSDTMILVSVDPAGKTAAMLSIPRDLWVNISGFGYGRINEAYFNGEVYALPGGGPELARQTVQALIGVPIHYYTVIDFDAFVRFIDEIGGITVQPQDYVTVERRGGANRNVLQPGHTYTLDGELTLAYIRDRNTPGADVDRAHRQQEAILAVRSRLLKTSSLPQMIAKAPALYQEIASGIHTDMDLQQILQLGVLALQIDKDDIKKGVIGYDMTVATTTAGGAEVLEPIYSEIYRLRDELFATGAGDDMADADPQPSIDLKQVKKEAARIVILDGVGDGALAKQSADYLRAQGFKVVLVEDAGWRLAKTVMEVFDNKPHSAAYLVELMRVDASNIWNSSDPSAKLDIRITIGQDWALKNPLP